MCGWGLKQKKSGEGTVDLPENLLYTEENLKKEGLVLKCPFCNNPDTKVLGDEFMIEQVVTNYITNAIKHVDEKNRIEVIEIVSYPHRTVIKSLLLN